MLTASQAASQQGGKLGISITPYVSYVSSATIQLRAFSGSEFERNETLEISGGYGYGISVTKRLFDEDLAFGISVEYASITDEENSEIFDNGEVRIRARIKEELTVVPVELSGYFGLPAFTEGLDMYLGAGVGVYFGDRKRTVISLESETLAKEPGFGIVLMSGIGYEITDNLNGVFEFRFRQGEYRVKSRFPASTFTAGGNTFTIEPQVDSKVFLDGLKLSLGFSFRF